MSDACEADGCGVRPATLYGWPTGAAPRYLCTHHASPLCEWCGERNATLLVGSRRDPIRLCGPCRTLPAHYRKRVARAVR